MPFKKIVRSLRKALGKGSQPRANISGMSFGPKDIDSSQRDKKTGAIRLGAGGIKLSESGLKKLRGSGVGAAEAKPKARLGGGGFRGAMKKAVAGAQKARTTGAAGKGLGGRGRPFGRGMFKKIGSAVKQTSAGLKKDDEKDEKMEAKPFESGGAVKASSKGRGMGAATQGGGAVGGAAKKKGYAMGGMAMKKGYAAGGPAMKKGYAMGGAAMKKGYASGGSVRGK